MKTAEDYINEASNYGKQYMGKGDWIKIMKAYAQSCCGNSLNEVARRWHTSKLQRGYEGFKTIDQIILEIKKEIELP